MSNSALYRWNNTKQGVSIHFSIILSSESSPTLPRDLNLKAIVMILIFLNTQHPCLPNFQWQKRFKLECILCRMEWPGSTLCALTDNGDSGMVWAALRESAWAITFSFCLRISYLLVLLIHALNCTHNRTGKNFSQRKTWNVKLFQKGIKSRKSSTDPIRHCVFLDKSLHLETHYIKPRHSKRQSWPWKHSVALANA